MRLEEQWTRIAAALPEHWGEARVQLLVADPAKYDRASALLGPLGAGRAGGTLRFTVSRSGAGAPEAVRRLTRRIDRERISGTLELLSVGEQETVTPAELRRRPLAEVWDDEADKLPTDWTDLYAQVTFDSSDHLERGALLLAPLNPTRVDDANGFRFRAARSFGYGAAPQMVRRCLARCDEEGLSGRLDLLWALSDSHPVSTQGPVWYVGGKAV